MKPLGFFPRAAVTIVDILLISVIFYFSMIVAGSAVAALSTGVVALIGNWLGASPEQIAGWALGMGGVASILAVLVTIVTVYSLVVVVYAIMEVTTGRTPAKRLFGLQIRQRDGSPATRTQIVVRGLVQDGGAILWLAGFVFPPLAALGLMWNWLSLLGCFMALGSRRQALHDRLSGTAVFRG